MALKTQIQSNHLERARSFIISMWATFWSTRRDKKTLSRHRKCWWNYINLNYLSIICTCTLYCYNLYIILNILNTADTYNDTKSSTTSTTKSWQYYSCTTNTDDSNNLRSHEIYWESIPTVHSKIKGTRLCCGYKLELTWRCSWSYCGHYFTLIINTSTIQ